MTSPYRDAYNTNGLNQAQKAGYDFQLQIVPSNSLSDGIAPAGKFIVAPYIPSLRFFQDKFSWVVISSGKPLAFDQQGFVVPAGYRLEAAAYAAALATSVAAADAQALIRYTAQDVTLNVKNFAGVLVTVGEPVVKSWFTGTVDNNTVSYYAGVADYDIFINAGGDNVNPTTLNYVNFNPQSTVAIMCDRHQQYPLVNDLATIRSAPLAGIAGCVATPAQIGYGSFITYDRESNFVCANPTGDLQGFGSTTHEAIVGQVTRFRIYKNASTGAIINANNSMDKIVAPNAATASVLNQIPNSLNGGMPTFVTYSNGYGVVEFGLHTR